MCGAGFCDTACVHVSVFVSQFVCVSQFASLKSVSRDAERGVCGADQSSTSSAAAARTFCSVPMEDICYQLFISPYTTFFYLTLSRAPGLTCAYIILELL